jgi:hypothetical protein
MQKCSVLIADVAVGLELTSICCATLSVTQGTSRNMACSLVTVLGLLRLVMLRFMIDSTIL